MDATTIKVYAKTKRELDRFRSYRNESYDEILGRVLQLAQEHQEEDEGELSEETIRAIERSREDIKAGRVVPLKTAKKRLGL